MTLLRQIDDSCHGPKLSNVTSSKLRPSGQVPVSPAASERSDTAGRDITLTWWYTFLSIAGISVFLLVVAALVVSSLINRLEGSTWQVVVVLVLFLGSGVGSVYASWLMREGYGAGWPRRSVTLGILALPALSWVVTLFIPGAVFYGAIPLWITLSILLTLIPRAHRWSVTAAGLVLIALHGLVNPGASSFVDAGLFFGLIMYIVFVPSTFLVSGWLWHLIIRLDEARTMSSQLAVARERLRFASDLHDIQGHHLQVIALKAELAERLLAQPSEDHRTAAQEAIAEVRSLAEEAQTETRQLVRDLRVVSLTDELKNAKDVLEAADITTEVTTEADMNAIGTIEVSRLLGLAVREATTNILRHADATEVRIQLYTTQQALHLDIHNDGVSPSATKHSSTGLEGLRSRFRAAGGSIHTRQEADTFELQAVLPSPTREATT